MGKQISKGLSTALRGKKEELLCSSGSVRRYHLNEMSVVEVGADQVGGGGVEDPMF